MKFCFKNCKRKSNVGTADGLIDVLGSPDEECHLFAADDDRTPITSSRDVTS